MSAAANHAPDTGHLVWVYFDPQAGHEQAGRRPALVLSPASYNGRVGLALMCPITSRPKGYPFEVSLPGGMSISGVVLADQVKSLDRIARRAEFVDRVPAEIVSEVVSRLSLLLGAGASPA